MKFDIYYMGGIDMEINTPQGPGTLRAVRVNKNPITVIVEFDHMHLVEYEISEVSFDDDRQREAISGIIDESK